MLDGLFYPRAVAVIGASNNPLSIGHIVTRNLKDNGYKGPIYPINPKADSILDLPCYASVLDTPGPVDLVNVSIPARFILRTVEECGEKGVRFLIVHSAGFKEVGEEGVKLEREMVELAHRYGMRVYGPNSQGVQNADPKACLYANFTFTPQRPGNVSIVTQGGGIAEMMNLHLHNAGLGYRMYASYGNECDLSMPEILEYYGQDEGTKVIMMQTETFKDPRAFFEVASKITPHKTILAIKGGRTREGSVAVSSHTGSLVDQAAMATAMYRQAGVVEFDDTHSMVKTAVAMSMQNLPSGNRLGIITNTGAPAILAVDQAVTNGLSMAKWSDAGRKRLQETQYAEASLGNPVDVVATGGPDKYHDAIEILLGEDGLDMLLVFFVTAPFVDLDAIAARIKEAVATSDKPVVAVVETMRPWYSLIDNLRAGGIPVYEFAEDGARALATMAHYVRLRDRKRANPPPLQVDNGAAAAIIERHQGRGAYLPQADAFALLKAYGVPTPKVASIEDAADLAAAAAAVGFPCVLKVDSEEVVHKSDEGGVLLGIADETALVDAFTDMQGRFADRNASYVLLEQKPAGTEVIVGATAAPGLGSLVMFGLGGVFVEVMKDVIVGVAPLSGPQAREMIGGIKGYPILEGVRGKSGVDLEVLEDLLLRVSRLAADFPQIAEMDLNPIFAYPKGQAPSAVDVRIRIT